MNRYVVTENIEAVLAGETRVPTTVAWNRLEGRPRRRDFGRALRAEVRDPLWMLTRQWQFGEYLAEDAGSPVVAKVAWRTDPVAAFRAAGGGERPYDPDVPLETLVERRPVPLRADLRLTLGRRWRRLLDANGHAARWADFLDRYAFTAPDPADFEVTAHPEAWQTLAAIAGRAVDGGMLLERLVDGHPASDGLGLPEPERSAIDQLGADFLTWARGLFEQPGDPALDCWRPGRLEYSAGLSAPAGERPAALAAPEYRGGTLDWYSFDAVAPAGGGAVPGPPAATEVTSFLPTTVQFDGMPDTRHWAFEDGLTNFGDITVDTTDIAKLLLIEFGLVYANDWFLLPMDVAAGSLTAIRGLAVTTVFGERFWIEPARAAGAGMFALTGPDDRLFVPATAPARLQSAPVEAVTLVRDEQSNMVWGVETTVQLPDGSARRGREAALELHARYQTAVPASPRSDAAVRYTLMTSVPEHWIPFIPVHVDGDNREIQLQRAAMPRLLAGREGVPPDKIEPRTGLLREGLDGPVRRPYYLAEEDVERAGTVVEARWQRCRWTGGRVVTWLGYRRTVGRGEASSGLAFDTVTARAAAGPA